MINMNITNETKKAQLEELAAIYSDLLQAKRDAEGDLHTNLLETVFLTKVDTLLGLGIAGAKDIISTIVNATETFIKEASSGKDAGGEKKVFEKQIFEIHLIKSDGGVVVNRLVYQGLPEIDKERAVNDAINCCFKESGESDFHTFMKDFIGAAVVQATCSEK